MNLGVFDILSSLEGRRWSSATPEMLIQVHNG